MTNWTTWIEPAKSGRSKCVVCDKEIAGGAARVSEQTHDIGIPKLIQRYYHPRCALATIPDALARALTDVRGEVEIEDREFLETRLAEHAEREEQKRKEREEAAIAAQRGARVPHENLDPVTFQLTEHLLDHPDDTAALAVLGDQLLSQNDSRGELITVQLSLAAAGDRAEILDDDDDDDEDAPPLSPADRAIKKQLDRRRKLLTRYAPPLDPIDRVEWGVGFVRRMELLGKTASRLTAQASLWRNPSVRLLSELRVTFASDRDAEWIEELVGLVPASLRKLELGRAPTTPLPAIAKLVATLPRLVTLSLEGRADFGELASPALQRIELATTGATVLLAQLSPTKLPKLAEVAVKSLEDEASLKQALLKSWLKRKLKLTVHS